MTGSASIRDQIPRGHLGVAGMRQRIEQLGGAFSVASTTGERQPGDRSPSAAAAIAAVARGHPTKTGDGRQRMGSSSAE